MRMRIYFGVFCTSLLFLALFATAPAAQAEAEPKAQTTQDINISTDQLALILVPLTRSELRTEALAWRDLLKAKLLEIGAVHLPPQPAASEPELAQEELESQLAVLRDDKRDLVERLQIVVEAWQQKGADEKELLEIEQYISVVADIRNEVSDSQSAWFIIRDWATSRDGGLRLATNSLSFAFILLISYFLSRAAEKGMEKALLLARNRSTLLHSFITKSVKRVILFVGFLLALNTLGANLGPVLAVLGAAGFAIAFALQNTLGNFASGLMILFYRPFDVGHVVKVSGVEGLVQSLTLVSTTIRTFDNKILILPNNNVWGDTITNVTGTTERRVDMEFSISYCDDIGKALEIMRNIVENHPSILKIPEPLIRIDALADSSVNFVCRPWVKTDDYWMVYADIIRSVKEEFEAAHLTIPFPQRDVHFHSIAPGTGPEPSE